MSFRFAATLALGLAAGAAGWAVQAHGEDAVPKGRTLAPSDLEAFLVEAGHPSKDAKELPGMRRVEIEKDGATFWCDVALSPDTRYLWLTVPLQTLPTPPVPTAPLSKLLEANAGEAGLHFLVAGPSRSERIVLARALDNREVTPHGVGLEIRRFVEGVRAGTALWDVPHWPKAEAK